MFEGPAVFATTFKSFIGPVIDLAAGYDAAADPHGPAYYHSSRSFLMRNPAVIIPLSWLPMT